MTTETPGHQATPVGSIVRRTLAATLAIGLGASLLAALVAGTSAVVGAVIGAVMVCVFFSVGALVLDLVARLAPAASLLIALLTYSLKVVLVGLVFVALTRSGALDGAVDARWLGGTVIACTLGWLASQIIFSVRTRQLLYDLPSPVEEASVR